VWGSVQRSYPGFSPLWVKERLADPSGLQEVLYFDTVGTATFTKATYPWLRALRVRCQAGGGGGAGGQASPDNQSGGGGSGGNYAESFVLGSAVGSSVTITVGAGGTGGLAGANSSNGASSSFGSLVVATGGGGGVAPAGAGFGGTSTSGSVGDLIVRGSSGGNSLRDQVQIPSGIGGSSHLGAGGRSQNSFAANAGLAGLTFGGGGSGANRNAAGGAGAQGIVIVELYA
jgi:hypothetical protein